MDNKEMEQFFRDLLSEVQVIGARSVYLRQQSEILAETADRIENRVRIVSEKLRIDPFEVKEF